MPLSTEIEFEFPLLGISSDADLWGFPDARSLSICGPRTVRENMQVGMELIEPSGRRWVVRSVRRRGRAGNLLSWMVTAVLSGVPQSRIEHEVEAMPSAKLADVKQRVVNAMRMHPDFWCEPDEFDTVLPQRLAEVQAIRAIREVHDILGLDTFEAY
jgi:hypothetical protein